MVWADKMIKEYEAGRRSLLKQKAQLDYSHADTKTINSMINDMTYVINWLKAGYDKENPEGINKKNAYRIR